MPVRDEYKPKSSAGSLAYFLRDQIQLVQNDQDIESAKLLLNEPEKGSVMVPEAEIENLNM